MKKIIYFFVIFAIISILLIIAKIQIIGIQIGWILLTIEGCYLILFSFGKIEIGEVATLFFFGKPIKNLGVGLYFAPKGIFSVRKEIGTEILDELPAPPEKIYHGEGNIPEGMFLPIRIKFGLPKNNDPEKLKNDPYNHSMVLDITLVINWKISDLMIFLKKIGTIENCRRIFSAKAIEIFGDDFSTMTPAAALLELETTNQRIEVSLEEQLTNSGIDIIDAYVKPFVFPNALNEAVVNVSKERQDAISIDIKAEAALKKRKKEAAAESNYIEKTLKAKGRGKALIKDLLFEAEAVGIDKLVEIAEKSKSGEVVIWMKTLATALEKSKYSIIPGSDLFKASSGIKEMLEKIKNS